LATHERTADRQPLVLERAITLAQSSGAHLKVIRCVAPVYLRAERLAQRTARPSQWTSNNATDAEQDAWYAHLPADTLTLVTDGVFQDTLSAAVTFLCPASNDVS
jgi:predicted kinase